MSFQTQWRWLWLSAVLLASLALGLAGGAALISSLRAQGAAAQQEAARSLALALTQQQGDAARLQAVLAAAHDAGHWRWLRLADSQGQVLAEHGAAPEATPMRWAEARLLSTASKLEVGQAWGLWGHLQAQADAQPALASLRQVAGHAAVALGISALASGLLGSLLLRRWQAKLERCVAQAQALHDGRELLLREPRTRELAVLTRSMNHLALRLRSAAQAQAAQTALWQRQTQTEPISGLWRRQPFIAALEAQATGGGCLLLWRVQELAELNQRSGHALVDRSLAAVGELLQAHPAQVKGALAARLNGSDLALWLPQADAALAADSGRELSEAMRASLRALHSPMALHAAGISSAGAADASSLLAQADEALARAETGAAFECAVQAAPGADAPGALAWQQRFDAVMQERSYSLAEHPVCNAQGRLLFLQCPLRLCWPGADEAQAATRWLPMALRCKRSAELDLAAAGLALQAIARDGIGRAVHVAPASLLQPGFVAALAEGLHAQPRAARQLWLRIGEAALGRPRGLAEAIGAWRAAGAWPMLEHAGAALQSGSHWAGLGLLAVSIDARYIRGLAHQAELQRYAASLVQLARVADVQVYAEGVDEAADLDALWALGFDGATGPAVRLQHDKPRRHDPEPLAVLASALS